VNSYYVAALAPSIAALLATGAALVLRDRSLGRTCAGAAIGVAVAGGYAVYLLHGTSDVPRRLDVAIVALCVVAVAGLASVLRWRTMTVAGGTAVVAAPALLLAPAAASATSVTRTLGPFDSPFEPASVTIVTQDLSRHLASSEQSGRRLRGFDRPLDLSTETSVLAAQPSCSPAARRCRSAGSPAPLPPPRWPNCTAMSRHRRSGCSSLRSPRRIPIRESRGSERIASSKGRRTVSAR
jgi:hypothetical protein